ncbi:PorP/SprF family type IX secretion system membrane protein [Ohtaekwangia sp.]|uniref:PorP/SprF family type IX secretion system membrane protein n=1 Tax=Ohtaekwangia sp. TaxID=2066019 RepID=UPI002FDD1F24
MKLVYRCLLFVTGLIITNSLQAQQSVIYSHYYLNPSFYNPSFAASNGHTELYLSYRSQWAGVEGAPATGALSLQLPLNYRMSIALSGYRDKAGALTTTTGLATFGYQVHLGSDVSDNHKLAFGLSAGVTSVSVNSGDGYANDPVVGATSSFEGQFGMHYQRNNFKIAFAIPHLFNSYVASDHDLNKIGISRVRATISSASYSIYFSERVVFEPMVIYRTYDNTPAQVEGLGSLQINNVAWVGASFRQSYGASAFVGFNVKDKLKLGYAHEFATGKKNALGSGADEVQLILRLGKKKLHRPVAKDKVTHQAVAASAADAGYPNEDSAEQEEEKGADTGTETSAQTTVQYQPAVVQPEPARSPAIEVLPATVDQREQKEEPVKSLSGNQLASDTWTLSIE